MSKKQVSHVTARLWGNLCSSGRRDCCACKLFSRTIAKRIQNLSPLYLSAEVAQDFRAAEQRALTAECVIERQRQEIQQLEETIRRLRGQLPDSDPTVRGSRP